MGEIKKSKKPVLVVITLLAGALLMAGQHIAPVAAEESDVGADVTVTEVVAESYGASIADSSRVIRSSRALEEPDNDGAMMLVRGWASIELDGIVKDCQLISVWLAKRGWRSAKFSVYASTDGNNWTHIGDGECTSKDYERHDFSGAFGNVRCIKIERNLWWAWSIMLLDAVYAKGGDAQQEKKD
jgi:hypothetical protein